MVKKRNVKFRYKIVDKKDNDYDSVIEKYGTWEGEVKFTINDIKRDIKNLLKRKIEYSAKIDIEEAMKKNIERNYDLVKKLTDKEKVAVFLYQKAVSSVEMLQKELDNINNALDGVVEDMQQIEKQCGIKYVDLEKEAEEEFKIKKGEYEKPEKEEENKATE